MPTTDYWQKGMDNRIAFYKLFAYISGNNVDSKLLNNLTSLFIKNNTRVVFSWSYIRCIMGMSWNNWWFKPEVDNCIISVLHCNFPPQQHHVHWLVLLIPYFIILETKMPMTAPVLKYHTKDRVMMGFMIPFSLYGKAPQPNDSSVRLFTSPASQAYVK